MLKLLQIEDFAIIHRLDLELQAGMTVFTGETGAGKSIVIEALGLALGERADADMVRTGAARATVTAAFDALREPVPTLLAEHGLDTDEGECILKRQLGADGRSRAFINGSAVPLQVLREVGDALVDIHGQHAHQSLLRTDAQRDLLDAFGRLETARARVATAWRRWRDASTALQGLTRDPEERRREEALLEHDVAELETLPLTPAAQEELQQEHARLSHAAELLEGAQQALELIDEEAAGAVSRIDRAYRLVADLQRYEPRLGEVAELLEASLISINEASASLQRQVDRIEIDPERLRQAEERLAALQAAARKHRMAPEELGGRLADLRQRLESLRQGEARWAELAAEEAASLEAYGEAAAELHEARVRAAQNMGVEVTRLMQELGMSGGRLEVAVTEEAGPPSPHGRDRVELLVTTNPGQPLRPLAKVASGGEISRLSLAIQVVAAADSGVPTLIFDEVDVGIGGRTAEIVGRQLRTLAASRQVLCVTHLPQVAALGHQHVRVSKHVDGGETRTAVEALSGKARVEEIARMLGGLELTRQTLDHAKSMLTLSQTV